MERTSESGLPIDPVYDASKLTDFRPEEKLARPGAYPFTRGVYPRMYVDRPWTMRQYAGFATAQESNRRYHELIEAGTTGLSVAFDREPGGAGLDQLVVAAVRLLGGGEPRVLAHRPRAVHVHPRIHSASKWIRSRPGKLFFRPEIR